MPMTAYASCQGQLGESDGSKDAKNPNPQKAVKPSAKMDPATQANTDRRESTMAASSETESTPTTTSNVKVMVSIMPRNE